VGDGDELPPVRLDHDEQPVSVAMTVATTAAFRQAATSRVATLWMSALTMRNVYPERRPYNSGTVADQRHS
jgi:hypothetical protein